MGPNWRRHCHQGEPEIQYCRLEDLELYPGEGPCVDGYFYWLNRGHSLADPEAIVKRIPLEIWRQWGKTKHAPPREKGNLPSMKLTLFTDSVSHTKMIETRQ